MPSINLDKVLAEIGGEVTLFGTTYGVKSMDGAGYSLMARQDRATAARNREEPVDPGDIVDLDELYDLAQRLMSPPLTTEERGKLTPPVVGAITSIAAGMIRAVEHILPNSLTLTTETPPSASTNETSAVASESDSPNPG